MRPELMHELDTLSRIFESVEMPFASALGASEERLKRIEEQLGLHFDEDLRAFWKFSNGGGAAWFREWFAVFSDELTPCEFASIEDACEAWSWLEPYDDASLEKWRCDKPVDERIKPGLLHRKLWFPIAEFNGYSTAVYFDADPAPKGRYGQIIVYQHDPDAVYYVADGFLSFFKKSNRLLSENITQHFFAADEFDRICHMKGLTELRRQMAAGLDVNKPNWRDRTLRDEAKERGRLDIVEHLDQRLSH